MSLRNFQSFANNEDNAKSPIIRQIENALQTTNMLFLVIDEAEKLQTPMSNSQQLVARLSGCCSHVKSYSLV
jgi:hypothetical protein